MEEAKYGQSILSKEERLVIARAVDSPKFKASPVSAELIDSFSDDLTSFASIPYTSKSRLSSLYGPGLDAMALLCADWKEAYAQGALYMRDPKRSALPHTWRPQMDRPLNCRLPKMHRTASPGFSRMFPLPIA